MTTPAKLKFTIYQGATFSKKWQRLLCSYEVVERNGRLVSAATGKPVPESDLVPDDYTGCSARMQARTSIDSPDVLFELSTANSGITLDALGNVSLDMDAVASAALKYGEDAAAGEWKACIGQVEVTRADAVTVERQYEITFMLSEEGTK